MFLSPFHPFCDRPSQSCSDWRSLHDQASDQLSLEMSILQFPFLKTLDAYFYVVIILAL